MHQEKFTHLFEKEKGKIKKKKTPCASYIYPVISTPPILFFRISQHNIIIQIHSFSPISEETIHPINVSKSYSPSKIKKNRQQKAQGYIKDSHSPQSTSGYQTHLS